MTVSEIDGVYAPVLTPFDRDLAIDQAAFSGYCGWLVSHGVGLCVFGTNSEANSLTVGERVAALEALRAAGIAGDRLMPGSGACAVGDAVELSRAALACEARAVLMLPPFYYKKVSEEGLFAAFSQVIEQVGDERLKIVLYNIPQVSGVAITPGLVARLVKAYPRTIAGVKESTGIVDNTLRLLETFPDLRIFPASEALLAQTVRHGAAGCISAGANINPAAIVDLLARLRAGAAAGGEDDPVVKVRRLLEAGDMIAGAKHIVATFAGYPGFARVRPPLREIAAVDGDRLIAALRALEFSMPGLKSALSGSVGH